MSYSIIQLEVTQPLPNIQTSADETGVALVIRCQDRPIGFIMQELSPNSLLNPEDLQEMLSREMAENLLKAKIQEDLSQKSKFMEFPSLTVAMCTKDRPDNVARCLNSLQNLKKPDNLGYFEILIIDNAPSDDQTQKLVSTFPDVRYVRELNVGLDFARNRAIKEAKGDILAFLDDDIVVDTQWLLGLIEAWTENPDAGAFTGMVLPFELETPAQILFERRGGFGRGFKKIRYGQVLDKNPLYPCGAGIFGAGCNMAFKRALLLELGGFDEALDTGSPLPGGGDLDIFYRVIRAGYPLIYEPSYLIYHQHRREMKKLRRQYWSWGLGFMAFVVKSYQNDPSQQGKFIALIKWWFQEQCLQLLKSLLGRQILPPEMILAELWGGIQGLFGSYERSQQRSAKIRQSTTDYSLPV
ncbi:glycosyltransferase [Crocosphaera sp. UHCC 0190]|uniref:glycosyltransferase family 2 protein n=1 Tax=Crocosphaera sp. UHCC 0190 TaxID=3110246 RepID=UPI002B20B71D|nr:glycosyltransferase [Crocosphaera sp. UHCC 0190]MEA5511024.1 glycosyltransferase [Crocosphaera sp. UHCC 0190]